MPPQRRRPQPSPHTGSIRAARPDGAAIYIICDNLSANTTPAIRAQSSRDNVEPCLTPTSASWANPVEAKSNRGQGCYSPTTPSSISLMASRCPLCRAVSWISCTYT
jgi:hypothetical protein